MIRANRVAQCRAADNRGCGNGRNARIGFQPCDRAADYAETNTERLAELDRALRQAGVDTLRFSTGEPFAQTLQQFFETRRGRRRG